MITTLALFLFIILLWTGIAALLFLGINFLFGTAIQITFVNALVGGALLMLISGVF